ncbi:MAG: DUF3487 family protein [Candidatus Competibacteraceae bacterium]|nr:MAG: DUF3487 family protein [Candidatus Competibacteraceae bacterium]
MKPELALTQLEREPIVQFGCTWSEIQRCIWRGAALALPATLAAMFVLPAPPMLMLVPGVLGWLGLTYGLTRHIHRHRAGKPLYYERHRKAVRAAGAPFVRPGAVYQQPRNDPPPRRPAGTEPAA